MSWDGAYYESSSVRVLRGAEERTIARWEADGWELVARPAAGRRGELFFRRVRQPRSGTPAAPSPLVRRQRRRLVGAGVAGLVVAGAVVVGAGGDDAGPPAAASGSGEGATVGTRQAGTDRDLAEALAATDACDEAVSAFALSSRDQVVEVDATVTATAARPGSTYDVVLRAGDHDDAPHGPAFALVGVTVADLHLAPGSPRDYVGDGDDVGLTATVGDFDADSCLLRVTPQRTELR